MEATYVVRTRRLAFALFSSLAIVLAASGRSEASSPPLFQSPAMVYEDSAPLGMVYDNITTCAAVGDLNLDGRPDLVVSHYHDLPSLAPRDLTVALGTD